MARRFVARFCETIEQHIYKIDTTRLARRRACSKMRAPRKSDCTQNDAVPGSSKTAQPELVRSTSGVVPRSRLLQLQKVTNVSCAMRARSDLRRSGRSNAAVSKKCQHKHPQKSRGNEHGDTSTRGRAAFHCPPYLDDLKTARLFF